MIINIIIQIAIYTSVSQWKGDLLVVNKFDFHY